MGAHLYICIFAGEFGFTALFICFYSIHQCKPTYTTTKWLFWLHLLTVHFVQVNSKFLLAALNTFISWFLHMAYWFQNRRVCEDVYFSRFLYLLHIDPLTAASQQSGLFSWLCFSNGRNSSKSWRLISLIFSDATSTFAFLSPATQFCRHELAFSLSISEFPKFLRSLSETLSCLRWNMKASTLA